MKLLITGAKGQLGTELLLQLKRGGSALGALAKPLEKAQVNGVDLEEGDLSKPEIVQGLLQKYTPDVVINCAAFTQVDRCETEADAAFAGNAIAPRNLAIACEKRGAKLVHVSTDYVFDGKGEKPFSEADLPAPHTVYGTTKLLGEDYVRSFCSRHFVVRTAWLYGRVGGNFIKTVLKIVREKGEIKVVNDQLGNPTNAEDLAHHLLCLAASEEYGLYHATGQGVCSWYDLAKESVRLSGLGGTVHPCTTEEFPRPAKRPAYSALEHTMLRYTIGDKMRPWQEALAAYMDELDVSAL